MALVFSSSKSQHKTPKKSHHIVAKNHHKKLKTMPATKHPFLFEKNKLAQKTAKNAGKKRIFENCKCAAPQQSAVQFMTTTSLETFAKILPRVIRIRDAPFYLGMDKNRFNAEVRPSLTEIKVGTQGIAFDRLELDAWFDDYKNRHGKPRAQKQQLQEKTTWQRKSPVSSKEATASTLTRCSKEDAFAKALAQATSKKHKVSSRA